MRDPPYRRTKDNKPSEENWRRNLYEIIFEAETPAAKFFDEMLIVSIVLSLVVVMLDSVNQYRVNYGQMLLLAEWFFTILFTVEYLLRMSCVRSKARYAISFFGIVDLVAILPTYLSIFLPGAQYLIVIRTLRVLRVFRVLKLGHYLSEADLLVTALRASQRKIIVFIFAVLNMVVIIGSLMYLIEGDEHGFTSIPRSIYWAIVTLTTVGFGDIVPQTALGRALAAVVMIIGYGIIAVPTGIVTAEIAYVSGVRVKEKMIEEKKCPQCGRVDHDIDANFCKYCGAEL